jgi:hypothetical protein
VVVTIDADLQDPPELIVRMLEEWEAGAVATTPDRTRVA